MKAKYCGIDYSLTSPAICVWDNNFTLNPLNCKIYYLTSVKKSVLVNEFFVGKIYPPKWSFEEERHDIISNWAFNIVFDVNPKKVFIEGYSYGSVGKVFNLAENMGLLKHKLWKNGFRFSEIPPTTIKKHATGKGNATKDIMNSQYITEGGPDLRTLFKMTPSQWNPTSDIIDSYYVLKTGVEKDL
jgi:Holliday junction resolvasome RuvABC endonuclease subunit